MKNSYLKLSFERTCADVVTVKCVIKTNLLHQTVGGVDGGRQAVRHRSSTQHTAAVGNELTVLDERARHVRVRRRFGGNGHGKSLVVRRGIALRRQNNATGVPVVKFHFRFRKISVRPERFGKLDEIGLSGKCPS